MKYLFIFVLCLVGVGAMGQTILRNPATTNQIPPYIRDQNGFGNNATLRDPTITNSSSGFITFKRGAFTGQSYLENGTWVFDFPITFDTTSSGSLRFTNNNRIAEVSFNQNSVTVNTNVDISGYLIFSATGAGQGEIRRADNTEAINVKTSALTGLLAVDTLNWITCLLTDVSDAPSLNWDSRIGYDISGDPVFTWGSGFHVLTGAQVDKSLSLGSDSGDGARITYTNGNGFISSGTNAMFLGTPNGDSLLFWDYTVDNPTFEMSYYQNHLDGFNSAQAIAANASSGTVSYFVPYLGSSTNLQSTAWIHVSTNGTSIYGVDAIGVQHAAITITPNGSTTLINPVDPVGYITNIAFNTIYGNPFDSHTINVTIPVSYTTAPVAGSASIRLYITENGSDYVLASSAGKTTSLTVELAATYTATLSSVIPSGWAFYVTNSSTGAGNSATTNGVVTITKF